MHLLAGQIPEQTIRQAVEAVFRSPAYHRTSLWERFWSWLGELLSRFVAWLAPSFGALRESPVLYWALLATLGGLTAAAIARSIILWRARRRSAAGMEWERLPGGARGDAWLAAQQLAARGDYTAAAHALYASLLDAAARQQQVKLHPSKTAGDYVREVRRRASPLFAGFRDFARAYEVVIYGIGACNRDRYERLLALALPIVRPGG
jgi:hypothetical protein